MTNSNDSLIDLTLKALKGAYEILLYNFEAIPTSGETVTTNVRPVFNDICEAVARLEMSMDCGSCSEISVVEAMEAKWKTENEVYKKSPSSYNEGWVDGFEEAIEMVKATKPVSVSLEKCVDAIALSGLFDADIEHAQEYYVAITKAVLDAAGVKYVD